MAGDSDRQDRDESRKIAIVLVSLVLILGGALLLMLPALSDIISVHLAPGMGLKDAAIVSFFVTVVIMIVFAITAGEGLLGEIQFILAAFFLFFVILWLLIAWIF
jgi:hypothetical protein